VIDHLHAPDRTPEDVLTVRQAAEFLKIGRTQLYDAIGRGEIPHRKIGRSIRLSRAALVAWLNAPCNAPREGH
jgi:excisionase family DNA binding protein